MLSDPRPGSTGPCSVGSGAALEIGPEWSEGSDGTTRGPSNKIYKKPRRRGHRIANLLFLVCQLERGQRRSISSSR